MNADYIIRYARADELAELQQVENAAGRLFAEIGLDQVADDDPLPLDILQAQQRLGLVWVVADADDQPVGFVAARELDGTLYIEEIDVHPAHGRRGLGKWLIETLCDWAARQGFGAVTLTTFRDVPWNAPFYASIGFRILEKGELSGELSALHEQENLDWFPLARVCMRRNLKSKESDV